MQTEENRFTSSDYTFWKGFFLVVVFVTITPIAIFASFFSLYSLRNQEKETNFPEPVLAMETEDRSGVSIYASLPTELPTISISVETADARAEILKEYLKTYHSPLEPYSKKLVEESDKNGLDYRLLTAIAQQESNLCKIIPPETYNCWGWGIHSQGTLGFRSFEEGIETVSKGLKENYIDKGYVTIEDIMAKYTPQSEGSWAFGVNKFMFDIEDLQ